MIAIVLRIFAGLNALIGVALVAAAVWPSQDPTDEKTPVIVVVYLIWAALFFGLAFVVFNLRPIARKWTVGLYGFASAATLWGLLSDVKRHDRILAAYPVLKISVYLFFLAFFIWPVVFILRQDVKEYITSVEQDRVKREEESGRASLTEKK